MLHPKTFIKGNFQEDYTAYISMIRAKKHPLLDMKHSWYMFFLNERQTVCVMRGRFSKMKYCFVIPISINNLLHDFLFSWQSSQRHQCSPFVGNLGSSWSLKEQIHCHIILTNDMKTSNYFLSILLVLQFIIKCNTSWYFQISVVSNYYNIWL